ncbi:MAG: universal stress protein [Thermodesulfobacteriota bacterium]
MVELIVPEGPYFRKREIILQSETDMEMNRILWATDGSGEAELALEYAKYIARLSGAEIIGVHVIPLPVQLLFESLREEDEKFHEWQSGVERRVSDRFVEVRNELLHLGIKFDGVILKGIPSDKIREFSRLRKADIIVMGKQGHGIIESMMVGSETVKVLKSSHIPVLAVKRTGPGNDIKISKIIVPIDLADENETALDYALGLSGLTGADVTAVYALRLDMYAQDMPAGALDIVIKQSAKELRERVDRIKDKYESGHGVTPISGIKTEVIHGLSPAISIANYASRQHADLIVINTHARTGLKRLVLGSVTERLIPEAPCSVLSLRP